MSVYSSNFNTSWNLFFYFFFLLRWGFELNGLSYTHVPNSFRIQLARVTEKCVQKIVISSAFGRLEQTWLAQGLFGFFFFFLFFCFFETGLMKTCFVDFFSKKNRQINNTKRTLNVRLRSTCDILNLW